MLEELSPTLRNTDFSCVFADPAHTAQEHVVLAQLWVRKLREGFHGQQEQYGEERVGSAQSGLQLMSTVEFRTRAGEAWLGGR